MLAAPVDQLSIDDRLTAQLAGLEPRLRSFVERRAGSLAAEDIVSEVWHAALAASRRGQAIGAGWIFTVARNKVADHWRAHERRDRLVDRLGRTAKLASTEAEMSDVELVLERMRERDRSLLTRHYLAGYSIKEIAGQDGSTAKAIESALARARCAFRVAMVEFSR